MKKIMLLVFLAVLIATAHCFGQGLTGIRNQHKFSGDFRFVLDISSKTSPNYYIDPTRVSNGLKMAFYEVLKQRKTTTNSIGTDDIVFVDNNQEFRNAIIVIKVTNIDVMRNSYFMAVDFSVTVGNKTIQDIVSFSGKIAKNDVPSDYNEAINNSFTLLCNEFASAFVVSFFNVK